MLACALGVIAAMVVLADGARNEADRARQAQVLIEQVGTASQKVDRITWQTMATSSASERPNPALIADALQTYRDLNASLRRLHQLGLSKGSATAIEEHVGAAYGVGLRALLVSRSNPAAARRLAMATFTPAMGRLDTTIGQAAKRQAGIARRAMRRERLGSLGSLVIGLLLLGLLGWRLHRMQRSAAVGAHARAVERRAEERLRSIVRHSSDVVAVIDSSSRIQWIAESVGRVLGYEETELAGRHLTELVHPEDAHRAVPFMARASSREHGIERESLRLRTPAGDYRHFELVAENRLSDPVIDGVLVNLRDVSQRLELEQQLRHQAFHDTLTGLANRALFEDRLSRALARERRRRGTLAVMYIDLDDFKTVNDSLGHAVGDELLQGVAARLDAALRPEDTAARLGGDEFAVLIEELDEPGVAMLVAERFQRELAPPFELGGQTLRVAASIGVAYPDGAAAPGDVLSNADVAMYVAKELGRGRITIFEPAMHARVVERLELTRDLDGALERGELALVYQPVVTLDDGAIKGVEALLRWHHPERGLVPPDRFIPLAESSGLIIAIGRWVLATACRQLHAWQAANPALGELKMSVNVSPRQLADPGFTSDVRAVLRETGVAAGRVTLEITEQLLAEDNDLMLRQLAELKALGVPVAIDDFGTGYSALSYLRSFPVDLLKIDRSFMPGIVEDDEKARLVRGIVDMGHALGLTVVVEGIELPEQAQLMRELRAEYGQGFLFSRPVDADEIARMLLDDRPMAPARLDADLQG